MKRFMVVWILVFTFATAWSAERQKVILDCDLGGDIDDAFAVALLLASPEVEILGLVMGHGDTAGRGEVACRLLDEIGREDIPVYVGRPTAGLVGKETGVAPRSHQFRWADGFARVKPQPGDAAEFIVAQLRQYPGEIVLITVGPVCNMSDVIAKDPDALKLARRIVAMFGSFYLGYDSSPIPSAEWNVRADVVAAQQFATCGAPITYVGLDVTTFVRLSEESRLRLLFRQSPLTNALCGLYSLWLYEEYAVPDPALFDAVAVGVVLWPELFNSRAAHVRVTDEGFTVIVESQPPNGEIVLTIDQQEFLRRAMERYLKQNLSRDSTL